MHLKDVRAEVATRFRTGELDLVEATRRGLFCALGEGDVPVEAVIRALESEGYAGWYVLEQDTILEDGRHPPGGRTGGGCGAEHRLPEPVPGGGRRG